MSKANYAEHCSENCFGFKQREINVPINLFLKMVTNTSIHLGKKDTRTNNLLNTLAIMQNHINHVLSQEVFLPSTFQRQQKVLM